MVTFHELAPRLTRIEVTLDVKPGSLIEKAARGMRHVKRAVRADLHRYKAFIEMQELETGAWRGVIEKGEVVEPHDEAYDEERDYSDVEDLKAESEESRTPRTRLRRRPRSARRPRRATSPSSSPARSRRRSRSGGSVLRRALDGRTPVAA